MKNREVLSLFNVIDKLSQNGDLKFNVRTAYTFAKNKELLRPEAKIIYDLRRQILLEYGESDGQGSVTVSQDKINEVNDKIEELLNLDNEVKIIPMIIDDLEEQRLSIEDMENLMPMILIPVETGPPIFEDG